MGDLIYTAITSLDGYVADVTGNFDWSVPDEDVHSFVNELERPIGTYLFGRRLYEVMTVWDTPAMTAPDQPDVIREFAAIWQAADKIVYSTTLAAPVTPRTTIERTFDPEAIRRMKASSPHDISVGGAELAGQAIRADLVDVLHLIVSPIVVGGGKPALPADVTWPLELLDTRRFDNGVVHLHYRSPLRVG